MFQSTQSMVAPLRRALVCSPGKGFAVKDPTSWGYVSSPELSTARREHAALVNLLENEGVEVHQHQPSAEDLADSIFVYDPVLITGQGAVLLRMGKAQRLPEPAELERTLSELQVPILGKIVPPGTIEGGDLLWIDQKTLIAGLGFRTNSNGIDQLAQILKPQGISLVRMELPYYKGPRSCLHLLSLISMVDQDLAICHLPLMSVPLYQRLSSTGIELMTVPAEEFASQAPNILALAPRKLLLLEDNAKTIEQLQRRGCEVLSYRGREISQKAEGGPTCLVLPIQRD